MKFSLPSKSRAAACGVGPASQCFSKDGSSEALASLGLPQTFEGTSDRESPKAAPPYRGRMLVAAAATNNALLRFCRILVVFLLEELVNRAVEPEVEDQGRPLHSQSTAVPATARRRRTAGAVDHVRRAPGSREVPAAAAGTGESRVPVRPATRFRLSPSSHDCAGERLHACHSFAAT
jgi:hypothetical protein